MLLVQLSKKTVAYVNSYAEASEKVRAYIDGKALGGEAWYGKGGKFVGTITDEETRQHVAHVSYNGRVWAGPSFPYVAGNTEITGADLVLSR